MELNPHRHPVGRVLIIDEDVQTVGMVTRVLQDAGYEVRTATGPAALYLAHEMLPHVILVDIDAPGLGGLKMSQQLRCNPRTTHIPLVGMATFRRLRADGSVHLDDRLVKPFHFGEVCAVVARWVGGIGAG